MSDKYPNLSPYVYCIIRILICVLLLTSCSNTQNVLNEIEGENINNISKADFLVNGLINQVPSKFEIEQMLYHEYYNQSKMDNTRVLGYYDTIKSKFESESLTANFFLTKIKNLPYSFNVGSDGVIHVVDSVYLLTFLCDECKEDILIRKEKNVIVIGNMYMCDVGGKRQLEINCKYKLTINPYFADEAGGGIGCLQAYNIKIGNYYIMRIPGPNVYTTPNLNGFFYKGNSVSN